MTARVPPSFEATLGTIRDDRSEAVTPANYGDEWFELYSVPAFSSRRAEVVQGSQVGSSKKTVEAGTVLVCKINPRINRVWVVRGDSGHRRIASTEWIPFFPRQDVHPEYLKYYLQRNEFRDYLASNVSGVGGSLMRVRPAVVDRYPFPKRAVRDQEAIAASLDSLFSRLDAAVAALKRVQANLKRYRASVLKAACEGRLVPTEAELARRERREYEPASVLLERILKERRQKWEEVERSNMQAKGKEPTDDRWQKKYKEPKQPDTEALPELPEGWTWATWAQLSTRVTVGHVGPMRKEYRPSGIPFLRSQNVRENKFDPDGLLFISEEFHEKLAKSTLRAGDLVVVRSGGVGVTCVIPDHLGEANCADLVVVQQPLGVLSTFGAFYMNSVAKRLVREGQVGIALTHFNTRSVAALPVAVPPVNEQRRLVDEAGRRLSLCSAMEKECSNSLRRASALRQVILRSAFEGGLTSTHQPPEKVLASV